MCSDNCSWYVNLRDFNETTRAGNGDFIVSPFKTSDLSMGDDTALISIEDGDSCSDAQGLA